MPDQIKRLVRPTDVPDTGLICDLLWADPDKEQERQPLEGRNMVKSIENM